MAFVGGLTALVVACFEAVVVSGFVFVALVSRDLEGDLHGFLLGGERYFDEERLRAESQRDQLALILDTVASLQPNRILEVGCGYGRVTRALANRFPGIPIKAIDLSPDQIRHAETYVKAPNVRFEVADICEVALPFSDVSIAIELLLHYPTEQARTIIQRLFTVSPTLIHEIEPSWNAEDRVCCHVFWHDYDALYRGLAHYKIVDGQGASLLVASRG